MFDSYSMPPDIRLRLANERAADIRAEWGMANGTSPRRLKRAIPCKSDVIELVGRAADALSKIRLRGGLEVRDTCR
jgi:hypothetical protein